MIREHALPSAVAGLDLGDDLLEVSLGVEDGRFTAALCFTTLTT